MVKADAYGHGAVPVALALEAAVPTGSASRPSTRRSSCAAAASRGPILVLYPVPAAWVAEAARLGIAVAGGDLRALAETARGRGRRSTRAGRSAIHLEVETGPRARRVRRPTDLVAAARLVAGTPGLALAGLWTHFQAVEDAAGTAAQIERFDAAAAAIAAAGIDLPARHVAASAALMTDDVVAYDGVRPGLAIYGLVPDELERRAAASSAPPRASARSCR